MELASFNILPMQDFYDKYLPTPFWDGPLNERFDILGFKSTFFLNNMGSMVIALAMIPALSCILLVLKPLSKFSRRITAVKNKIHSTLFWSHQITLLNESYSMICMCALINAHHLAYDSKIEVTNSVLTIAFIFLSCTIPLIIGVFLLVKLP